MIQDLITAFEEIGYGGFVVVIIASVLLTRKVTIKIKDIMINIGYKSSADQPDK